MMSIRLVIIFFIIVEDGNNLMTYDCSEGLFRSHLLSNAIVLL